MVSGRPNQRKRGIAGKPARDSPHRVEKGALVGGKRCLSVGVSIVCQSDPLACAHAICKARARLMRWLSPKRTHRHTRNVAGTRYSPKQNPEGKRRGWWRLQRPINREGSYFSFVTTFGCRARESVAEGGPVSWSRVFVFSSCLEGFWTAFVAMSARVDTPSLHCRFGHG